MKKTNLAAPVRQSKLPFWIMLFLSWIGFADAAFLAAKYYLGSPVPCLVIQGCEKVLNSIYAETGSIPNVLIGSIYYGLIFLGVVAYLDQPKKVTLNFLWWGTAVGGLFSIWLLFVQVVLVKAFCFYCLISAAASIGLFLMCHFGPKKMAAKRRKDSHFAA